MSDNNWLTFRCPNEDCGRRWEGKQSDLDDGEPPGCQACLVPDLDTRPRSDEDYVRRSPEMERVVSPFPNGTTYERWRAKNCGRCTKAAPWDASYEDVTCEIEIAIGSAMFGDGYFTWEMGKRIGIVDEDGQERIHCGDCTERDIE